MKNQKKIGISLSYLNIVLGTIINLVLTPLLIVELSNDSYSIYKVMHSFSAPVVMLNLGFSTIVARSTAKYQKSSTESLEQKQNVFATSILLSVLLACIALLVGVALTSLVPYVYGQNYSQEQLALAQKILMIFIVSAAFYILADPFKGCISGNEKFCVYYGMFTVHHIIKFCLTLLVIHYGASAEKVAFVDLINNFFIFVVCVFFSCVVLKEKPKFHYFNKIELYGIFTFGFAILLQTIINQINNNMDLVILGACSIDSKIITMYSVALTIYTVYNSLLSVFVNVYFPQITRMLSKAHTSDQLTSLVIRPGRLQAALAVAVVFGFALYGKDFIRLWVGESYTDAYFVALILMIPVTIPLVQNVCIAILDAKLKRLFRSVVLLIMALINFGVSVILVKKIGFFGAACGTAISLTVGHIIIMNIYYSRVIGIQVYKMFKGIFYKILPIGAVSAAMCLPLAICSKKNISWFLFECIVFFVVYVTFLWRFGFTKEDKRFIVNESIEDDLL